MENRKIRILISKIGSDIHELGAFMLLNAFRDAGMEAIYTGRYQSPAGVARAAVAEDVDVIALSDHTGSMPIIADFVIQELRKLNADDIHIIAGGLISPEDVRKLEEMNVTGNYTAGTPLDEIIEHVRKVVRA
ncbi:Methylmalonyl-coA mutase, small subunit [Desulfatibacillum aliphaticivorans]|uniref:Methylmalonyl-coA mutase, small subunit n=1 Tax=Desulfatibacillum aliphaticivorans TaxID=218208 RepID=B8FMY3_DESAL|nr:cobalamin B12-binding domain-containing protein [Desulfatibacillum aliphaticivorans]ACL05853.1 Methylmalonyl-coA mutase, small subunit [Desulfatibacillum aliphaticivorans]